MMHDASDDEAHALEREHSAGAVEVGERRGRAEAHQCCGLGSC